MNSNPVPSRDRLIATTTTRATVMVRFPRRPIPIAWRTNCAPILADSSQPCFVVVPRPRSPGTVPRRSGYGSSVRLAVHTARLVADPLAVFEFDDPLAHGVDAGGGGGGHDHGGAGPVDPVEHLHDADRGGRVDVSGGLVGQQDHRPVHERAGHGDPLLLAAGQLVGHPVVLALQADQVDDLGHDLADEPAGLADDLQGEGHVLVDVLVRQQPEVLEHAADPAAEHGHAPVRQPGQVAPGHPDTAVGGSLFLEHQPQESRFTRAGRADEKDKFALLHANTDVLQSRAALARVDLADVIEVDHRTITAMSEMDECRSAWTGGPPEKRLSGPRAGSLDSSMEQCRGKPASRAL